MINDTININECKSIKFNNYKKTLSDLTINQNNICEKLEADILSEFMLKTPNRSKIIQLITDFILETESIYTIRDDKDEEMWIYVDGIYIANAKTYIKEWCESFLFEKYTTTFTNAIIAKIQVNTYIDKDDFFKVHNVDEIAVLNGILNIKTKKLDEFSDKKIFFNKINANYNPKKKCPNIIKHMESVLSNKEDVKVIMEMFGYCLYRDYKIEKAFMLSGDGRNGKGKTVELLKLFLHPNNCCNVSLSQIESDSFAMINFHNKMANIAADLSNTALRETGNFKQLTGHDMISANRKGLSYINFVNYAKLIFCANELPMSSDDSNAFWNRWVYLKFPYTFLPQKEINKIPIDKRSLIRLQNTEQIKKMTTEGELSGLLNEALNGLNNLLKNGDFSGSQTADDVKLQWIRESDSVTVFIDECIEEDWDCTIRQDDMRKQYQKYCIKNKVNKKSEKLFKEIIKRKLPTGLRRQRIDGEDIFVWECIRFKDGVLNK